MGEACEQAEEQAQDFRLKDFVMRGVDSVNALQRGGSYKIIIECRDLESFMLLERKLRLIGIFVTEKKGF